MNICTVRLRYLLVYESNLESNIFGAVKFCLSVYPLIFMLMLVQVFQEEYHYQIA